MRRSFRAGLASTAALLAVAAGALTLAAPANATPAPDCKTVTSTLVDHPDNGHGTGGTPAPGHWADDSGTRTVKICVVPAPSPAEAKVAVESALFHAVVLDHGTFTTKAGDHLSPNHGAKLVGNLTGSWDGGFDATFVAPAPTSPGVWPNFTPAALDGKTFTGSNGPKTGEWIKSLWTGVQFGEKVDWTAHYKWTYLLCNERWIDAADNKDGQGPGAGDITGLSKLPCFGNPSFTPKCDGTVVVVLTNAAPSATSVAVYLVNGEKVTVAGGSPGKVEVTVKPDAHGQVVVARPGKRTVYQFSAPKCPSGSPSPVVPPPGNNGGGSLPVTGPKTIGVLVAGVVLIVAGVGGVLFARRRRIRFEA